MSNPQRYGKYADRCVTSTCVSLLVLIPAFCLTAPSVAAAAGADPSARLTGSASSRTAPAVNESNRASECARRYHGQLSTGVLPLARRTQTEADALRSLQPAYMPGLWQFWDGNGIAARTAHQQLQLATPLVDYREKRLCTRQVLVRGGRIRCLQWQPLPPDYVAPTPEAADIKPSKPKITKAERRIAARLQRRVIAKGRFPEFDHDTALYHIAQRTTDELIAYSSQPYRQAICSGAPEMIEFYRQRLKPIDIRAAQAERLQAATHLAARAAGAALVRSDQAVAHEPKPTDAAAIRAVLSHALTAEELSTIHAHAHPLEQLRQARILLTDARLDQLPDSTGPKLRKALRNHEFALYAMHERAHLMRLSQTFRETLDAIHKAHVDHCACNDP